MRVKRDTDSKVQHGGGGGSGGHASSARGVAAARPAFELAMEDIEVRELLERLEAVASKLSIFPAERLLSEYRIILKELLNRAMNGYKMKRDLKWRRNDRATYVTVERAEAALEELEKVFLQEGGRSRALQLMEEIKGCLISLLF